MSEGCFGVNRYVKVPVVFFDWQWYDAHGNESFVDRCAILASDKNAVVRGHGATDEEAYQSLLLRLGYEGVERPDETDAHTYGAPPGFMGWDQPLVIGKLEPREDLGEVTVRLVHKDKHI